MNVRVKTVLVGVAVAATASTLLVGLAGTASASTPWGSDADSVGSLTFYDASGNQITGGAITDAPFAKYVQGSTAIRAGDTKATLFAYLPKNGQAPGAWSGEALSASTNYPNAAAPGALGSSALPLVTQGAGDVTIAGLAGDLPNTAPAGDPYEGLYQLRLKTSKAGLSATATYASATIKITGSTWTLYDPLPVATATTTTLTTTPASPQVAGTSITLTATVSPAAAGSVQFKDGSAPIGAAVAVSGGIAVTSNDTWSVGPHSLSAVFVPTNPLLFSGSTGTASFTITAPPAAGTTTSLSVTPGSAAAFTPVVLHSGVVRTSNSAVLGAGDGSVKFFDNGTTLLGTAALTASGADVTFSSFAQGAHSITAQFIPADAAVYNTSTSLAVDFTATAPAAQPAQQDVTVTVPAGTLTITTPYSPTTPFDLGSTTLSADGTRLSASADFGTAANPANGITITDRRAGNQPWTAQATVTDFSDGSGHGINGQNLSFTQVTPSYIGGNALQAGSVTTTDITTAGLYAPAASGSDGLKGGPHTFATAANGNGTAYVIGKLGLLAPTSTVAGVYTAQLTFTIA